jgi:peptide-methionine (S)-S-oxide reductase
VGAASSREFKLRIENLLEKFMINYLSAVFFILAANFSFAAEQPMDKQATTATAVFAGGCFWCMEKPYDHIDGVIKTESGYIGGRVDNPSYEQVSAGSTGHYEAIQISYDPKKVSYEKLLEVFWQNIDPFDARGQFCDKGQQYQAAIFVANAVEAEAAKASLAATQKKFTETIVTTILPAKTFYPAEGYHQDYYLKNPVRYNYYRYACGRDQRLKEIAESSKSK